MIIDRKVYNTTFGDLVPMIVADALNIDILIIENYGHAHTCRMVESEGIYEKLSKPVMIYKNNDHYDSIVCNYSTGDDSDRTQCEDEEQIWQIHDYTCNNARNAISHNSKFDMNVTRPYSIPTIDNGENMPETQPCYA